MINEKEIWYNKETHRTYLAEVVGTEFAMMKCIVLSEVEGSGPTLSGGRLDNLNLTIKKDIHSIIPMDDNGNKKWGSLKWIRIGIAYVGSCNTCNPTRYFDLRMLDIIKKIRASDPNYNKDDLSAYIQNISSCTPKSGPCKMDNKTVNSQKPVIKKVVKKKEVTGKVTPKKVIKKRKK